MTATSGPASSSRMPTCSVCLSGSRWATCWPRTGWLRCGSGRRARRSRCLGRASSRRCGRSPTGLGWPKFRVGGAAAGRGALRVVSTCAKVLTKVGAAHFFVLYGAGGWLEMDPRMVDGEAFLAKVEAVVAPVLEAHGLQLVDLQWRREARRWALRFFVDKPGGAA